MLLQQLAAVSAGCGEAHLGEVMGQRSLEGSKGPVKKEKRQGCAM